MTDKERADQLAAELEALRSSTSTASMNAVQADRERRAAIMALPEAEGLTSLAEHLYAKGESVDDAKATLAATPKQTPVPADDVLPDPRVYEARRAAGAGLGGGSSPTATAPSLVATMRKQLGKEAA